MSAGIPRPFLRRRILCFLLATLAMTTASPCRGQGYTRAATTVFAADGAGNFQTASAMLRKVARADSLPLEVVSFEWSHGYLRIVSDQCIYGHARRQGHALADIVLDYHAAHPDKPIALYGHSAGCSVVVAALEELPSGIVDRAVLLSPSMSAGYDLGPALAHVNCGLHVFYSRRDWWYLGLVTGMLGTADRRLASTSGRIGFDAVHGRWDPQLDAKLCQRVWRPDDRTLGNAGGHYGNYQPAFLRTHVVPLLVVQSPSPRS
jgi:pimeloyl-ACP methyl ester carboxylesterase